MNKSSKSDSKVVTKTHKYGGLTVEDTFPSHSVIDDVYYTDLHNWKRLPRGCAIVKTAQGDTIATLHGTPKFGDSSDNFGHMDLEWDTVCATVKENGECFHVTFFTHAQDPELSSEVYCLIGSKNVHILVTVHETEEQLSKIAQEQPERTRYAIKMARAFFKQCYSSELAQMICETGVTLCGEYINPEHKHIVQYSSEQIKFFAITHPDRPNGWYTVYTPEEAIRVWTRYNLEHVEFTKCTTESQLQEVKDEYYSKDNSEGLVVYYCRGETVINMHKYKNKQYTILRTIRELYNSGGSVSKLQERLQNYHLKLSLNEIQVYIDFFKWCKSCTRDDDYSVQWWYEFQEQGAVPPDNSNKAFILFIGVPGSGKTTIGCTLMMTMLSDTLRAKYIDQDMCGQNPKLLSEQVSKLLQDPATDIVIHGKSNTTKKMREQSMMHITDEQVYIVVFEPNVDCIQRIRSREYHPTLKNNHPGLEQVVKNFIHSYEAPTEEEFVKYENFREIIHVTYGDSITSTVKKLYREIVSNIDPVIVPFCWSVYLGIKINDNALYAAAKKLHVYNPEKFPVRATRGSCHVTLIYNTDYNRHWEAAVKLYSIIGQTVKLRITGMCWDTMISAFKVELEPTIPCLNTQPHISWYKADNKIQNVASNTMFENCIQEPIDLVLEGVISQF